MWKKSLKQKQILLDFSNTNNEIIDEPEIESETEINEKYKIKPLLPPNFSLYKEKEKWCLGFCKTIDNVKFAKRFFMECLCIQTELDRLIDILNNIYNFNIPEFIIENPYDFVDQVSLKIPRIKPSLCKNFSICTINDIDYIQFSKKKYDKKYQYKTKIKSYNLQKELDDFIDYLNNEYNLQLSKEIIKYDEWKTTNKIKE